MDVEALKK